VAPKAAGVQRIIYLRGLSDLESGVSEHLRSRQEAGAVLRGTGVTVTEFRALVIVGSGSLSFETIRCLTERLPGMISRAGCTRGPSPSPSATCCTLDFWRVEAVEPDRLL
jgi:uncharacterized protein YbjT (DUF2867 family)